MRMKYNHLRQSESECRKALFLTVSRGNSEFKLYSGHGLTSKEQPLDPSLLALHTPYDSRIVLPLLMLQLHGAAFSGPSS
jgi:hypothetical protein